MARNEDKGFRIFLETSDKDHNILTDFYGFSYDRESGIVREYIIPRLYGFYRTNKNTLFFIDGPVDDSPVVLFEYSAVQLGIRYYTKYVVCISMGTTGASILNREYQRKKDFDSVREAEDFLKKHYPNHEDPFAYWDFIKFIPKWDNSTMSFSKRSSKKTKGVVL